MARMVQVNLSAARLDELLRAGNSNYRRVDDGNVERICTTCNTWQPADIEHFYVVVKTHGREHPPRYRSPCRQCDAEANRRRRRLSAEGSSSAQPLAPVMAPLSPPPAPPRIRAAALPEPLTGMRECRHCGIDMALDATCFEPVGRGFSTVCIDCKAEIDRRVIARKTPLILPSAAGATRSAR